MRTGSHLRRSAVLLALAGAAAVPAQAGAKTLDQTFGNHGIVTVGGSGPGSPESARAIVVQGGKLLTAGLAEGPSASDSDFGLVRLNGDGSLDTTFGPGHDGKASASFGGTV